MHHQNLIRLLIFLLMGLPAYGIAQKDSVSSDVAWELGIGPGLMVEGQGYSFSDGFYYKGSTQAWCPIALNGKIGCQFTRDFAVFISNTANIVYPCRTLTLNNALGLDCRFRLPTQKRKMYAGLGAGYDARVYPFASDFGNRFNRNGISLNGRAGVQCMQRLGVELAVSAYCQWHTGQTEFSRNSGAYYETVNYTETHYGFIISLRVVTMRFLRG